MNQITDAIEQLCEHNGNCIPIAGIVFRPDVFDTLTVEARGVAECNACTRFYGLPAYQKCGQKESYLVFHDKATLEKYLQE